MFSYATYRCTTSYHVILYSVFVLVRAVFLLSKRMERHCNFDKAMFMSHLPYKGSDIVASSKIDIIV
jgi:hypothetical protein